MALTRLKRKVPGEVVRVEETPPMKQPKARKKQSERSKKKSLCDTLFSEAVRLRDESTCRYCGKTTKMAQAHHIFSRNHMSTRYDLDNGVTLCYYCHMMVAHHDGGTFIHWAEYDWLGHAVFEALYQRMRMTVKVTDAWYDEQEARLRAYIAKLQERT